MPMDIRGRVKRNRTNVCDYVILIINCVRFDVKVHIEAPLLRPAPNRRGH